MAVLSLGPHWGFITSYRDSKLPQRHFCPSMAAKLWLWWDTNGDVPITPPCWHPPFLLWFKDLWSDKRKGAVGTDTGNYARNFNRFCLVPAPNLRTILDLIMLVEVLLCWFGFGLLLVSWFIGFREFCFVFICCCFWNHWSEGKHKLEGEQWRDV